MAHLGDEDAVRIGPTAALKIMVEIAALLQQAKRTAALVLID